MTKPFALMTAEEAREHLVHDHDFGLLATDPRALDEAAEDHDYDHGLENPPNHTHEVIAMTTDVRLQVLALRTAADIIEGCATEGSEITLAGLLSDPGWFEEVLFGTLDNLDHPEGVELFDRETYATVRREVLALIARADYGPAPAGQFRAEDTTPRELAEELRRTVDADDLADLARLLQAGR